MLQENKPDHCEVTTAMVNTHYLDAVPKIIRAVSMMGSQLQQHGNVAGCCRTEDSSPIASVFPRPTG
jgi:hypothetical protein